LDHTIILHDRPDFGSFSREIIAKKEIEITHTTSGWDFVKIDGVTGYLPTEEAIKEQKITEKIKHRFLADEQDIQPKKGKGFWGDLFG